MTLKDLYKGKSLDDLKKYYEMDDMRNKQVKLLLASAKKLYEKAEKCQIEGDEELSYIYFMRYFNLVDQIRNSPNYSLDKRKINNMLGGNQALIIAMDKAEQLSKSLEERYGKLSNNVDNVNDANNVNDADNEIDPPVTSNSDVKEKMHQKRSINTCEELFRMTQDPSSSLLIMDCRPKEDFESSRLRYYNCLNVPEEIILPGSSAGIVQRNLKQDSKSLWASRSIKDKVVLMDWNSQEPVLNTPIWRLKDILLHWDPDVNYKTPIKILQGGYENYILHYPTECTNPNVQSPLNLKSDVATLEDIEYPSINDIKMKNDIDSRSTLSLSQSQVDKYSRPDIDRTSKAAALKKYGQQQSVFEILEKQEKVVDKTIDTQKKIREAEDKFQTISNEVENTDEDKKSMLLAGQQELIYNIMQLKTNERDYKLEIDRLKTQLDEYKQREKELGEKVVTLKEAENLKETVKRIEVKRDQIDEKDETLELQDNEKQLTARNEKRHMKPPTDDEISKPKIPQFDRSIKPTIITMPTIIRESPYRRDFSPVPGPSPGPGLTGLKNLGNTCYMNSIMQCLSNTTALVQYFKTNTYKKHINRSNKTRGKIVEEVGELINVLWSGKFKCVASKDLRYVIGQYQQIFRGIEQQDSHEFLTILMDWLHSDLQTLDIGESPKENLPQSEKAWLDFTKSCESIILRLFYGQIKSTVKCAICGKESATYECFSNLSLELPQSRNHCELYDCLEMYFFGEKINGWNCPNCKQKRDAVKKLDISKLPPILVIHLKRFYADTDSLGIMYRKKQTFVDFPLYDLDMKTYIAPSEKNRTLSKTYNLYAVSNHYGSMEAGHYTAFCKSGVVNRWFKFDDQVVSRLDTSDVVSSAAYILFYTCYPDFLEDSI